MDAGSGPRSSPEADDEEMEGSNTSSNMDSPDSESTKVKGTEENVNNKSSAINPAVDRLKKGSIADEPFEKWERDEMERLLGELRGHLGEYDPSFSA
jgi:phospholipase D1/2